MAHLTFSQIQDAVKKDVDILNLLARGLKECNAPQDAESIAEHIESIIEALQDGVGMIGDILAGRIDLYEPDGDIVATYDCQPPRFTPDWAIQKRFDDGSTTSIRLDDYDEYKGRCPQCGAPVTIPAAEFYSVIMDEENHCVDLETGVYCSDCVTKHREQAEGGQE